MITGNTHTMTEVEKNLEAQPAQETGEDRTLETPQGDEADGTQGVDPLDLITDPKELAKEAKKYRAIANRKPGTTPPDEAPAVDTPVAPAVTPAAPATGEEFLSKRDFERSNERKAINSITTILDTDDEATRNLKKEIDANWDSIKVRYVPRHGRQTPEDIQEDILDAHATWRRKAPAPVADPQGDAARALTTSPVVRPGSTRPAPPQATNTENDPRYKGNPTPKEWYTKRQP